MSRTLNLIFCAVLYAFAVKCGDSYLVVRAGDGGEAPDYVADTIRRLSRSPHHFHASAGEAFQCSETKKRSDGEGEPNVDVYTCPKHKNDEIRRSVAALKCQAPHSKIIKLKLPGPNYALIPSVASVKRCSGDCSHPRTCLPSKKKKIRIPVYQIDKTKGNALNCVDFELEEHEECRCGCTIESHHCTGKQIYKDDRCACVCNNPEDKELCLELAFAEPNSRFWDDTTCECHCLPLQCPRSMLWVPKLCRCARISDDMDNVLY